MKITERRGGLMTTAAAAIIKITAITAITAIIAVTLITAITAIIKITDITAITAIIKITDITAITEIIGSVRFRKYVDNMLYNTFHDTFVCHGGVFKTPNLKRNL